eukprot:c2762_g1_i1.p1 GENE.c2762_g1_i1~~c2762_g1_i1.p1  ORF type:complete len:186 (-),score=65.95 c2762_g1_i1:52-609(-)
MEKSQTEFSQVPEQSSTENVALLEGNQIDFGEKIKLSLSCCGIRYIMTERDTKTFLLKTLFVFVLTFSLIPLIQEKEKLSSLTFTIFLVALHVFILIVYFYRVKFRSLDLTWRSVLGRVLALIFTVALLFFVAENEQEGDIVKVIAFMLALCVVHTFVLLLLVVRIRPLNLAVKASSSDPIVQQP